MAKHTSWEDTLAHLNGDAGADWVEGHLRDCPRCASQEAEIRRLVEHVTHGRSRFGRDVSAHLLIIHRALGEKRGQRFLEAAPRAPRG